MLTKQSHLNYGLPVWGWRISIGKVFVSPNKSMHIINNTAYNFYTEPLFTNCQISTISEQYKHEDVVYQSHLDVLTILFYQISHWQDSIILQIVLVREQDSHLSLNMFPRIWNELGSCCQEMTSMRKFKRWICVYYLNRYKAPVRCCQCFPDKKNTLGAMLVSDRINKTAWNEIWVETNYILY